MSLSLSFYFRCLFDYVDIFMIDLHRLKHFHDRVCGMSIPAPVISIHQRVELVFKSHYIKTEAIDHKGFKGTYTFIEESKCNSVLLLYSLLMYD